ncbi:MAG TPA: PilZ domain-containing protein [Phycisphaerae bacterium]|nr:PilZ domain-containing protein [Phycisphaerae bacterium]
MAEEQGRTEKPGDNIMQRLNIQEIDQAITTAVAKHIPLSLSIQSNHWINLRSRFIDVREGCLIVELPSAHDEEPHEFVPAERISLSFKLKHHKYLGSTRVRGITQFSLEDDTKIPVLSLCFPMHMQRLKRRSFTRVNVPEGRIVRASFWPGGKDCEPTGPSSDVPVWSGSVEDISAGGFQVHLRADQVPALEVGQIVGVRIVFGVGDESIYTDAQFRHCSPSDGTERFTAGFQFVGLVHTEEGRTALQTIARKMNEFVRFARNSHRCLALASRSRAVCD